MTAQLNLSIIVPVFNAGPYLHKAAESVFDQSFTDYELIFVNDGSTDNSLAILKEIAEQDPRVKVFSQKNKGVTAARKLGWLHASAEYVTFLDADDEFSGDGLQTLMKALEEADYDVVNGSFIGVPSNRLWQHKIMGSLNKTEYLDSLVKGETFGVMYASVYKRQLFQESSFTFDKTIKVGEDVLMNLELCKRVVKIKNLKEVVYQYTDDNTGSVMNVIVRHPSYYLRFNKIRDSLIKAADHKYYETIKESLLKEDNNVIINSFFSPFIPFDKADYLRVRPLRKTVEKNNLYVYCLSHIGLAKLAKIGVNLRFTIKNGFQDPSCAHKKILY